jgi:hypothetical protein
MGLQFQDTGKSLSQTLTDIAHSINTEHITLRQLFELVGEQGLLLLCAFLTIPFLIPVSIPGVSTVFGAAIILISIGITLNRLPWVPGRLMNRPIATEKLIPTLDKGAQMVAKIERFIHPRLEKLTDGATISRLNGLALVFSGFLLMFPLSFIPFSNTLPGLAILFLAIGILQRDGFFIIGGFLMMLITLIYFSALFVFALLAGQSFMSLLSGG